MTRALIIKFAIKTKFRAVNFARMTTATHL